MWYSVDKMVTRVIMLLCAVIGAIIGAGVSNTNRIDAECRAACAQYDKYEIEGGGCTCYDKVEN